MSKISLQHPGLSIRRDAFSNDREFREIQNLARDVRKGLQILADAVNLLYDLDSWHEIGTSGEPVFQNSWTNYGSPYTVAAFYKDPYNVVRLKGFITGGTSTDGTVVFTLPEGYRPSERIVLTTENSGWNPMSIDVYQNGEVKIYNVTNNSWITLDGLAFRV